MGLNQYLIASKYKGYKKLPEDLQKVFSNYKRTYSEEWIVYGWRGFYKLDDFFANRFYDGPTDRIFVGREVFEYAIEYLAEYLEELSLEEQSEEVKYCIQETNETIKLFRKIIENELTLKYDFYYSNSF